MTRTLPYRPNVGAALFNRDGHVFIGRRLHIPERNHASHAWQMPQGGIDAGEDPRSAVLRELKEEIGTANATILAEHDTWLSYDLPADLIGTAFGGKYRGQRQKWFALRFNGIDAEIDLASHGEPEFDSWRWASLTDLPALAVPFKRPVYDIVVTAFAHYAVAEKREAL